jgi:photosystem II stability/assembly factor-like uncharacterized protein
MDEKSPKSLWKMRLSGILLAALFTFFTFSLTPASGQTTEDPTATVTPATQTPTPTPNFHFLPIIYNPLILDGNIRYVVYRQGAAFDTCSLPSLETMQAWWKNSPYRIYNIYLGGPAFPTDIQTCNYTGLNSAWLAAADQQGWTFILTWAGWQAPCRGGSISYDQATAYVQGVQQADLAISKARSLGFLRDLALYVDIEAYKNTEECNQAVAWYVSGWVNEVHQWGGKAGVYGLPSNLSSYRAKLTSIPDNIWMAYWYADAYLPTASVYGIPNLPDNLWSNHQRILQYAGDHGERYGGVNISGMDSDVVDSAVQAYGPNGLRPWPPAPLVSTQSLRTTIQGQQMASTGEGWIWTENRLWRIWSNGASLEDLTPLTPVSSQILDVHFYDANQGWVAARSLSSGEVLIFRTLNGGQTWEGVSIPDPDGYLAFGVGNLDLEFVDGQTGWASVELQSSAIFSPGLLYRTLDGGRTWSQVSAPAGGEIRFVDTLNGWLTGGPGGGQLFETRNGGFTWQSREAAPVNATGEPRYYHLPVFSNPHDGLLPLTWSDPDAMRLELYTTEDGGQTWFLAKTVSLAGLKNLTGSLPLYPAGDGRYLMALPDGSLLEITGADGSLSTRLISPQGLPAGVKNINSINAFNAWALTQNGDCSGDKDSAGFQCAQHSQVFATNDGGLSWNEITPGLIIQ